MPVGNQMICARVGTYNFSRKVLIPKIFSSKENNFYTAHCLSKIMAYLVLMLYYFLSICLVIFVFHKLLFFMLSLHTLKNQVMLYFLSVTISVISPLWHCYYLDQVMLRKTRALKNCQLSNLSLEPKGFSCP